MQHQYVLTISPQVTHIVHNSGLLMLFDLSDHRPVCYCNSCIDYSQDAQILVSPVSVPSINALNDTYLMNPQSRNIWLNVH